jgi:hypothetical protein
MTDLATLAARVEKLEHELAIQQDIHQIRRIQYTYGYFIDKSQYQECLDLFSDEGEVWFLGGVYKGKAGLKRLYIDRFRGTFTQGHNGPRYGWLLDHPQLPFDDAGGQPRNLRRHAAPRLVGRRPV